MIDLAANHCRVIAVLTGGDEKIVVVGDLHGYDFFVMRRSRNGNQVEIARVYVVNVYSGIDAGHYCTLTVLGQRDRHDFGAVALQVVYEGAGGERVQPELIALTKHQQKHRIDRYIQHLHGTRQLDGVEQVKRVHFPQAHHAIR